MTLAKLSYPMSLTHMVNTEEVLIYPYDVGVVLPVASTGKEAPGRTMAEERQREVRKHRPNKNYVGLQWPCKSVRWTLRRM
jgi:hypothetical protein